MDEETTIPTPEEEPTPEPTPDPTAELTAREEAVKKREAELQKGFEEVARKKRELDAPPPEPEDIPDLDPQAQKVLDNYIKSKYGDYFSGFDTLYTDLAMTEMERFAEKESIEADKLRDTIAAYNLNPRDGSIRSMHEVFKTASDILKSKAYDPEAERARLKEELLREIQEQGVQIESITPARTDGTGARVRFEDEDATPEEKYQALKEKGVTIR